jgi:hypothetical protein
VFDAEDITFTPAGDLASTDVQSAIAEHVGPTDTHAASAITFTPLGDIAATEVQGAIDELNGIVTVRVAATRKNNLVSTNAVEATAWAGSSPTRQTGLNAAAYFDGVDYTFKYAAAGFHTETVVPAGATILSATVSLAASSLPHTNGAYYLDIRVGRPTVPWTDASQHGRPSAADFPASFGGGAATEGGYVLEGPNGITLIADGGLTTGTEILIAGDFVPWLNNNTTEDYTCLYIYTEQQQGGDASESNTTGYQSYSNAYLDITYQLSPTDALAEATMSDLFVSTEQTGTGASQNIAHGLTGTPTAVFVAPTDLTPVIAGSYSCVEGAHDGTDVIVTVTSGKKFKVMAWV